MTQPAAELPPVAGDPPPAPSPAPAAPPVEPPAAAPAPAELPPEWQNKPDQSDPDRAPMSVLPFLRALVESGGSDLHCKVGSPPRIRVDGRLRRLEADVLNPKDTQHMVHEVLRSDLVSSFDDTNEADFAYAMEGVGRFRVNAFRQRGTAGLVFRAVSEGAIPLTALDLPEAVAPLALEPRGLVLVTGPTGSGKTTTLSGMVDYINQNREVHIVTIEDPIEVVHEDKVAMVNQREVHVDTENFATAMRAAMRQDPDVILVGEMRDQETVRAAISAAETGHFVMSTLHTVDAEETITRIIDFFPPHEQTQVRLSLSGALRGILCQRLVPKSAGSGRAVAMEICVNTGRVAEAIADSDKTSTIGQLVAEGGYYGMQTFDQHLTRLFSEGHITLDAALASSTNPHDLIVELRRLGLVQ